MEWLISLPTHGSVVIIGVGVRLPLHLFLVRSRVPYFKCDKGLPPPGKTYIDSGIGIESVPKHITEPASEN